MYNVKHYNQTLVIGMIMGLVSLLLTLVQPASASQQASAGEFLQAEGANLVYKGQKVILKGTNFDNIGALGAGIGSGNVNDIYFNEADYAELRRHGGNHVRLGLSFNWYQQNKERMFQRLDEQVAWARKYGIWLVFNMFTTPGDCYEGYGNVCGFWKSSSEQQQLRDFWVEMAQRYRNEPAVAGYDLLNEPTPGTNCTAWFPIAGRIQAAVAAVAPNQLVFIETCSDPGNDLRYNNPPRGRNIVYEVHDYTPMDASHDMFSPGSVYPGVANEWFGKCYYDKSTFTGGNNCPQGDIRESHGLNWAKENNLPIYVGEWGATSVLKGYVRYHQDKAELYRDWGVNHAHYTWKHQTIKTGGYYQWGIYSQPLNLDDPAKLEAVKIAWQGAVYPDFSVQTNPSQPTATAQPAPTVAPTAQPAATVAPTAQPAATAAPTAQPAATAAPTAQPAPTVAPTAQPAPPVVANNITFYRGINLNGKAAQIEGNLWEAERNAKNYQTNGVSMSNKWMTLTPAVDEARTSVLQAWRQHWAFNISMSNIPSGTYQVYLFTVQDWNDPNAETARLSVEGQEVGSYTPGGAGTWQKLGPFSATISDGTLNITTKGLMNLAGLEVWQAK